MVHAWFPEEQRREAQKVLARGAGDRQVSGPAIQASMLVGAQRTMVPRCRPCSPWRVGDGVPVDLTASTMEPNEVVDLVGVPRGLSDNYP